MATLFSTTQFCRALGGSRNLLEIGQNSILPRTNRRPTVKLGLNKARNRDESRTVCVFDPADKLDDRDWQAHAKAVIRVERVVYTRSARTGLLSRATETAFYLSNTPVAASRAAEAIRAHWGIETTSHYSRDVTLAEDRSRIRTNPGVFARLRSFAFNILKANQVATLSQDRYRAALGGFNRLAQLITI